MKTQGYRQTAHRRIRSGLGRADGRARGQAPECLKTWLVREGFGDNEYLLAGCLDICGEGCRGHFVALECETAGKVHSVLRQRGSNRVVKTVAEGKISNDIERPRAMMAAYVTKYQGGADIQWLTAGGQEHRILDLGGD